MFAFVCVRVRVAGVTDKKKKEEEEEKRFGALSPGAHWDFDIGSRLGTASAPERRPIF